MVEVVTLDQLVGKLRKRQSVFPFQTLFDGILGHHVVNCDQLAHISDEIKESEVTEPVIVIHHFCCIGEVRAEIEELHELITDPFQVFLKDFFAQHVAFLAFKTGIAHHSGSTTHKGNRFMTGLLKVNQEDNRNQAADMEGIGRGIKAHITGSLLFK